jgi:chromate transporter
MSSSTAHASLTTASLPHPSLLDLFLIWLRIGATSFGGGSATQLLIQRHFVTQRRWMTPEEFAQAWAIVQFAPGINLIALTVLIGHRFGRWLGIAVSLLGMLAPAVGITIVMTALYARVRDLPQVQGALRGVTPALVGLSLAFMWRLLKGPTQGLRRLGPMALVAGGALLSAAAALTVLGVPVLVSYLVGAVGLGIVYAKMSDSSEESDI